MSITRTLKQRQREMGKVASTSKYEAKTSSQPQGPIPPVDLVGEAPLKVNKT